MNNYMVFLVQCCHTMGCHSHSSSRSP